MKKERVFFSYDSRDQASWSEVAEYADRIGLPLSGQRPGEEVGASVGDVQQQLQAASVTVVLLSENSAGSEWVAEEIRSSLASGKGLLGLRLSSTAPTPESLYDAGAEILDWHSSADREYFRPAVDAAARGARLLEAAAKRGSGSGAPCARREF